MLVETTPKQRLADFVKEIRGKKSQRSFAKLLGVSYYAVQSWEKQAVWPDDDNLQKLADLKGWTLWQLQVYLQVPQKSDKIANKHSFDSGFVENLELGHSTRRLRSSVNELLAEVRALPFEAAAEVAKVALETMAAKGS
jgi:transcriptional regulator with XRE-family HTH domain